MADEVLDRVEKQMEGTNLALAAVAEVLQKMDYRLSKEDEDEEQEEMEKTQAAEKADLVKAVATEVAAMLKADNGLDVDGTKVRSAGKSAAGAADAEKAVNIKSDIKDQQATIQAMLKAAMEDEDEDDMEKADEGSAEEIVDEDEEKGGMYKAGNGEDEDDDMVEEKSMEKQLDDLKKQIADYEANMAKAVQTEAEDRLRKMGFREETGLVAPKVIQKDAQIGLGVDGSTPLKKSADSVVDTVDQLMDMSYQELRNIQYRLEAGETDGLPRELIN
tara:strand:- start:640 stop:1464 length:825 start_codon:yes stop_codon:yes gene_type:complete